MSAIATPGESPARPPRLWVTLLWIVAFALANLAANFAGIAVYLWWRHQTLAMLAKSAGTLTGNGVFIGVVEIVSAPLLVAFALLAARLSSRNAAEYLGLRWPSRWQAALGLLGLALFFPLDAWLTFSHADASATKFAFETYRSAEAIGALPLLFVAFALAAPLIEETTFRGFFYSRFALRLGALPAIIITAALWAVLHVQYDPLAMVEIFVLGLMLGAVRRYTGSVLLTTLLHGIWNAVSLVEVMYALGH
jgi:membrane protease YdiL (CAAX protease family)